MKKTILSLTLFLALNPLFAEEALLEGINNTSKSQEKNLEYLFKNSKFPVNDYIYKTRDTSTNDEKAINELKKIANNEAIDTNTTTQPLSNQINENNQSKIEEIKKMKKQLQAQNQALEKNIIYDENARIKRLLRDSILASRNSEIKDFNNNNRFGSDSFSNQKSIDISTNEHRLYRMIRAGRLIPATLTSSISSDLSGIVSAQIEQDIYASMGKAVLIPRGSKAIGFYTNDTQIGQNRLEIKWREIITPQGINILLTDAIVADNMGMSGAIGSVNNKYLERYGVAYGISTLTNALLLSIAGKIDNSGNTYAQEVYSDAKSDIGTIVNDIVQKQGQIKPTIEIKAGSRIYIVPTNHIWFSKPKNGEILMKYFIEE